MHPWAGPSSWKRGKMPALEEIRQIPKDPGYIGDRATTNWPAVVLSYLRIQPHGARFPDIVEHLQDHTTTGLDARRQITDEALEYLESLGLALCAGTNWHAKKVRI